MLKRICDRCEKEIVDGEYYKFEISHMKSSGVLGMESYFDLCPECFELICNFNKENKNEDLVR